MENPVKQSVFGGKGYPLVFDLSGNWKASIQWAAENKGIVESELRRYGSLYFRNTGFFDVEQFSSFAEILYPNVYRDYGDLPPRKDSRSLYGATPYPSQLTIHFHNEASHTSSWPLRQFFYCVKPAERGGELRVADGRTVLSYLSSTLIEEFCAKGLQYIRNFVPYYDVSWQEFFKVDNKMALERILLERGIEYEWNGSILKTIQRAPAIVIHPLTGEKVWFNQIQLHHPAMLDTEVYKGLKTALGDESRFPRYVALADGTEISREQVELLSRALDKSAVDLLAGPGDVILNDNVLVSHSRLPYEGDREVCVGLADSMDNEFNTLEEVIL